MFSMPKKENVKNFVVPLMIMVVLACASTYIAFHGKYFDVGMDAIFHLTRFESVYQSLAAGQWPGRFNFIGFQHQGAVITGMYPWLSSLIFILPRFFVGPFGALAIGFCILNLLTMLFTWLLMRRLTDKRLLQWLGVIVYQFNGYHFIIMYTRVAIGEAIGYMAVPLVLLGLVEIWNHHKWGWLPLGIGMAIVANGHILSLILCTVMVAVFEVYRLVSKKVDWTEVFTLLKGAGLAVVLSAYSLFTIFQVLAHNTLRPPTVRWETFTLDNYIKVTLLNDFKEYRNTTMGLAIGILMIVFLVLALKAKAGHWRRWIFAANALLLCCFNFVFVPWFINTPLGTIQFSMRLLVFVAILLAVGIVLYFTETEFTAAKRRWVYVIIIGTTLCAFIGMIQHDRKGYDYLKRVTPTSYMRLIRQNNVQDYVILDKSFKKRDYDFTKPEAKAALSAATRYDSSIKQKFTYVDSTFDSVTWHQTTTKDINTKLPVIGYAGVDYKVTVNDKPVAYELKNGHIFVMLDKGENTITVSAR